jgi:hypothetical protein
VAITPYIIYKDGDDLEMYIMQDKIIIAYENEYCCFCKYVNKDFVFIGYGGEFPEMEKALKPATKKELQEAGLWDFVANKEDFSSLEEQLDEYLRIGEEIEKEKRKV